MTLSTATRTQFRAICPVCFAQQAVTAAGRLAQHGYRRPQGWHQNVNDCGGSGRMHFGTEAGRATTAAQANGIRDYAEAERERAPKVASGELPITDRRGNVITSCAPWKLAQIADGIVPLRTMPLPTSVAILATSLLVATPSEQESPRSSRIVC